MTTIASCFLIFTLLYSHFQLSFWVSICCFSVDRKNYFFFLTQSSVCMLCFLGFLCLSPYKIDAWICFWTWHVRLVLIFFVNPTYFEPMDVTWNGALHIYGLHVLLFTLLLVFTLIPVFVFILTFFCCVWSVGYHVNADDAIISLSFAWPCTTTLNCTHHHSTTLLSFIPTKPISHYLTHHHSTTITHTFHTHWFP